MNASIARPRARYVTRRVDKNSAKTGEAANAPRAAKEEMRKIPAMINHAAHVNIPVGQDAISNTPNVVATPFPPLNRSQTGKLWPNTEKSPVIRPAS